MTENVKISNQNKSGDQIKIVITESLSIENSNVIKEKISNKLKKVKSIDLELENITTLDVSGVQLLVALKLYCNANNIECNSHIHLSDDVQQLMDTCGITKIIMN